MGCLELSGMEGLSLDGVDNEFSVREWTEAPEVTRGQRGVNGASTECEGSEWPWEMVAAWKSEQDRRRYGWGEDGGLTVESSTRVTLTRGTA